MDGFEYLLIPTRIPLHANSKPHWPAIYDQHFPAEKVDEHGLECLLVLSAGHTLEYVNHWYALLLGMRARGADPATKVCFPE